MFHWALLAFVVLCGTVSRGAQLQETEILIWVMPMGSEQSDSCGISIETACSIQAAANRTRMITADVAVPSNIRLLFGAENFTLNQAILFTSNRGISLEPAPGIFNYVTFIQDQQHSHGTLASISVHAGQGITLSRFIFRDYHISASSVVSLHSSGSIQLLDCHWSNITKTDTKGAAALSVYQLPSETRIIKCSWTDCVVKPAVDSSSSNTHEQDFVLAAGAFLFAFTHTPSGYEDPRCFILLQHSNFSRCGIASERLPKSASGGAVRVGKVSQRITPGPSKITIEINKCEFDGNKIHIADYSMAASIFSAPLARGGAVSIEAQCETNLTIVSSAFRLNSIKLSNIKAEAALGGALDLVIPHPNSTSWVADSLFEANSAHSGEGILQEDLAVGLCAGGAISSLANHVMTVQNCTFQRNRCHGGIGGLFAGIAQGGAISYKSSGNGRDTFQQTVGLRIHQSDFEGNQVASTANRAKMTTRADSSGGAIMLSIGDTSIRSSFEMTDSTFVENSAESYCGVAAGGSVSLQFLTSTAAGSAISGIRSSIFSNNTVSEGCGDSQSLQRSALGGAIFISSHISLNSFVQVLESELVNNTASAFSAAGGAVYIESSYPRVANSTPASGITNVSIENSKFIFNGVNAVISGSGGGVHVTGYGINTTSASVRNSRFVSNQLTCKLRNREKVLNFLPCYGGGYALEHGLVEVENSHFEQNQIGFFPNFREERRCGESSGGAIGSKTPLDTVRVQRTSFTSNSVNEILSFGGAISASTISVRACQFFRNVATASQLSSGGAIYAGNSLMVYNSNFSSSLAATGMLDNGCLPDDDIPVGAFGGSISMGVVEQLSLHETSFLDSDGGYGGAVSLSSVPGAVSFSGITSRASVARTAGGFLFVNSGVKQLPEIIELCASLSRNASSARYYGPVCGTAPLLLDFHHKRPPQPFISIGQQTPVSLVLIDAFNSTVVDLEKAVSVELVTTMPPNALTIRSGQPQDTATSSPDGQFRFDTFSVQGKPNASATVVFTSKTPFPLRVRFTFISTFCLPSYRKSSDTTEDVQCGLCPAQTFLLPPSTECRACPELPAHAAHSADHHTEAPFSCITPPQAQGDLHSGDDDSHRRKSKRTWTISPGYYPVPSLDQPTDLVPCPNPGCIGFECSTYVLGNLTWQLNCSACVASNHDHGIHSSIGECHCANGYQDRLCSKCYCTEEVCFFSNGEPDFRHCTKCQKTSTAIIVAAVCVLQVSLVIFLLFKRSAIALLLSELVIAVVLFILGIGEAWMLDIFIMLGLLFVITSLSHRDHKDSHLAGESHQASADENDGDVADSHPLFSISSEKSRHDSHHDPQHAWAAKTAAIAKIAIFFLQSTAALVQHAAWPSWIGSLISQLDALNFRVSGLECLAPSVLSIPVYKLLFQLSMPILVGINIFIAAGLAALILRLAPVQKIKSLIKSFRSTTSKSRRFTEEENADEYDGNEAQGHVGVGNLMLDSEDETESLLRSHEVGEQPTTIDSTDLMSRAQFSCFFLISASYFELNNLIFEVLRPCSYGFMPNFPWVPCQYSHEIYAGLMGIAITCFFLYTIGVPAFFGAVMLCNRKRLLAGDPKIESRFGFLFESYRRELFWWELVWLLRRVMLSVALSSMAQFPGYQMAAVMAVLMASLFLHRALKPFADKMANLLELAATTCLIFSIVIGSEIQQHRKDDRTSMTTVLQNLVWSLVALVTAVMAMALILPTIKTLVQRCKRKLRRD